MDLGLRTLRTFCEVIQVGSFTRAARRLGYSQSSVTAQVRVLENEIGEPVFQRLPDGVRLTPVGHTVHGYAQQLLALAGEMEAALHSASAAPPRIRLGLASTLAHGEQLARLTHLARRRLAGAQLALRVMRGAELHAALRSGELDGAVLLTGPARACPEAEADAGPHPESGRVRPLDLGPCEDIATFRVLDLEFLPVAAAERSRPDPAGTGQAAAQHVVVADPDCVSQRWLPELLRLHEGGAPEILELGSLDGVRATLRSGLGCAMLPAAMLGHRQAEGLQPLAGVPSMSWTVSLLCARAGQAFGERREALLDVVRLALGGRPGQGARREPHRTDAGPPPPATAQPGLPSGGPLPGPGLGRGTDMPGRQDLGPIPRVRRTARPPSSDEPVTLSAYR
jgi:DNA-binding transcriptional LysR family regulator